jgi:hypothetical protein
MGIGERYVDQIRDTYQTMYPFLIDLPHGAKNVSEASDWASSNLTDMDWAYFSVSEYNQTTFCFKNKNDAVLFSLRWSS